MTACESPFSPTLTREQIDHFHRRGYVEIGPLLEPELVEALRRDYDRLFAEARREGDYRNLSIDDGNDERAKRDAPEQMLQIVGMCERSILFRRLLYHPPILDRVQDLIGPNIQLFHDQALNKPPRQGGPVFWHQDNAYWKCVPANLVSCWMTLDDVDASNGAMHLLPESHLAPAGHERARQTGALLESSDGVDAGRAAVVALPAGGALLHHCQTLHYTPPNRTGRQRRAFVIHFMAPGTRSLRTGGDYMPVSFSRPMLRMRA